MHGRTCRKNAGGCGFEFCWLCRGPWTEHGSHTGGFYACNKYEKSEAKKEDDTSGSAKTELEYYMFYYHRYDSHKSACKVADEQRRNAERKGTELQEVEFYLLIVNVLSLLNDAYPYRSLTYARPTPSS